MHSRGRAKERNVNIGVEVALSINAAGAPELSAVSSVSPAADGVASIDQSTAPPTLSVDDYSHDTVVINLNAPAGETIGYTQNSVTVTPSTASVSHSWSSAGDPLTLTVSNLTTNGWSISVNADLSAESSRDPIFTVTRKQKPPPT